MTTNQQNKTKKKKLLLIKYSAIHCSLPIAPTIDTCEKKLFTTAKKCKRTNKGKNKIVHIKMITLNWWPNVTEWCMKTENELPFFFFGLSLSLLLYLFLIRFYRRKCIFNFRLHRNKTNCIENFMCCSLDRKHQFYLHVKMQSFYLVLMPLKMHWPSFDYTLFFWPFFFFTFLSILHFCASIFFFFNSCSPKNKLINFWIAISRFAYQNSA